jgi:predicted histidine transporter YuiF (NhaC family)
MKKFLAVVLIAFFSVMVIGESTSVNQLLSTDLAYTIGQLCGMLLAIGFLFFSVRWYLKLDGHTHKLARQTWATLLYYYSIIAVLMGIASLVKKETFGGVLVNKEIIGGVMALILWSLVGFFCLKWRQRLRQHEIQLYTQEVIPLNKV